MSNRHVQCNVCRRSVSECDAIYDGIEGNRITCHSCRLKHTVSKERTFKWAMVFLIAFFGILLASWFYHNYIR